MKVVVVSRDLISASRIEEAAIRARAAFLRVDAPLEIPPDTTVAFVNWAERSDEWGAALRGWKEASDPDLGSVLVLFGPHTELQGHVDARRERLAPVVARSRVLAAPDEWLSGSKRSR